MGIAGPRTASTFPSHPIPFTCVFIFSAVLLVCRGKVVGRQAHSSSVHFIWCAHPPISQIELFRSHTMSSTSRFAPHLGRQPAAAAANKLKEKKKRMIFHAKWFSVCVSRPQKFLYAASSSSAVSLSSALRTSFGRRLPNSRTSDPSKSTCHQAHVKN